MKLMIEIDNSIYDICKSVRNLPLDENDIMSSLIMQSIAKGTPLTSCLKCRIDDYMLYNIEWLKKHWNVEMKILGIEAESEVRNENRE